jgi:hypothetical protein
MMTPRRGLFAGWIVRSPDFAALNPGYNRAVVIPAPKENGRDMPGHRIR